MGRGLAHTLYFAALLAGAGVGLFWDRLSPGFGDRVGGLCRELISSGGGDDAMMLSFAALIVPAALRLMRWGKPIPWTEGTVLARASGLALAGFLLASRDCAAILHTVFARPDPALATALIALPLAWICAWRLGR